MKTIHAYRLLAVWLIFFTACSSKTPKEAAYIPKDAALVAVLNIEEVKNKLKKGRLNIDSLTKSLFKKEYFSYDTSYSGEVKTFTRIIKEPVIPATQIEKVLLFVQTKTLTDNSVTYSINILGMADNLNNIFYQPNGQKAINEPIIQDEKNFKTFYDSISKYRMSWNDEITMVTYFYHEVKPVFDTLEMTFKMPADPNIQQESKSEVVQFFNQSLDKSMASVDYFTDMFKEKADGYIFTSSNSSIQTLRNSPLNFPQLEELLKDNYTCATLHFETGKVRMQSTSYFNPTLSSLLRQYAGPVINWSLVKDFPQGTINMLAMASFQPEIIGGVLRQLELKSFADNFLSKSNLSLDDVVKAFKGELAVVVSDISVKEPDPMTHRDELSLQVGKTTGQLLVRIPVGDGNSYRKLMDAAVKNGWLMKTGNVYRSVPEYRLLNVFVMGDEKNLFIASDSSVYANYLANAGKTNEFINQAAFRQNNAATSLFYFNIAATLQGMQAADLDYSISRSFQIVSSHLKELTVTNDNFDGKSLHNNIELTLQDEKTNSLVSLTKMLAVLAKELNWTFEEDEIKVEYLVEDSLMKK